MRSALVLVVVSLGCGGGAQTGSDGSATTVSASPAQAPTGCPQPQRDSYARQAKLKGGACLLPSVLGEAIVAACAAYIEKRGWKRSALVEKALSKRSGKKHVCHSYPQLEPASLTWHPVTLDGLGITVNFPWAPTKKRTADGGVAYVAEQHPATAMVIRGVPGTYEAMLKSAAGHAGVTVKRLSPMPACENKTLPMAEVTAKTALTVVSGFDVKGEGIVAMFKVPHRKRMHHLKVEVAFLASLLCD